MTARGRSPAPSTSLKYQMENQLREQGAADKLDEVLKEIPKVREDLGYIPLVTPTSQIVGSQSVLNVLTGERYKSITKETAGVLKGEYGATAAPVNKELQARVLDGGEAITCRPADVIEPEIQKLEAELTQTAADKNIQLADNKIDDVLTYALFPQVGLKFLENRNNPDAFEPAPGSEPVNTESVKPATPSTGGGEAYSVRVDGKVYRVEVAPDGSLTDIAPASASAAAAPAAVAPAAPVSNAEPLNSPLAGNIVKVNVSAGQPVNSGDVVLLMEAMKMETEVRAAKSGTIGSVMVKQGDAVQAGQPLLTIA